MPLPLTFLWKGFRSLGKFNNMTTDRLNTSSFCSFPRLARSVGASPPSFHSPSALVLEIFIS